MLRDLASSWAALCCRCSRQRLTAAMSCQVDSETKRPALLMLSKRSTEMKPSIFPTSSRRAVASSK
ncbi:uncharacterized protein METZ01_LOCUS224192 [marine metagenome]|uniref:Uncharacterized protein n=1 Tax=marine metagenome TaxID=408172 RepID=A0A382G7Y1_9ZZZZ